MPSRKIQFCIIHPNLKCGGSERFISIICNHINTNIFNVELYILDGSNPFYQITNPDIKVSFLNIHNVRSSLFPVLKILKKSNPDILFISSNHFNLYISIFKSFFPKKLKIVARESSIISINSKRSSYGKLYNSLIKIFYKKLDHIICQSAYMQNDLIENYKIKKENTVIIYNPVEENEINLMGHQLINKTQYKFITVGRLSPEKGIDRLLNAVSLLDIDFHFNIVGDGPEKNKLVQLANAKQLQHKVRFQGTLTEPYKGVSDADLFLLGSHYEGFPNVLLEAGSLGIPVIAFNSPGGTSEIINEGINGFLVEDNNIQSFADAITKAVNHNFNREKIINHTNKNYSAKKITRELENYLLSI